MDAGRGAGRWRRALEKRWRAALYDLLGEEPEAAAPGSTDDEAAARLAAGQAAAAQAQLAQLRATWANLRARALQAEQDWRAAAGRVARLDAAVDEALLAGDEAAARATQRELNLWRSRLGWLDGQRRRSRELEAETAEAVRALERQMAAGRRG